MNRNDWYEAGDQIKKMVQDAVESKDFTELGDTISSVVNQTMDGLQSVLKETLNTRSSQHWDQDARKDPDGRYQDNTGRSDWYQKTNREAAERIRRTMKEKDQNRNRKKTQLKVRGEVSGQIMKWAGYSMSSMFGLSLAIVGVVGLTAGISMMIPIGVLSVLFGASFLMGMEGRQKVALIRRFRRYREVLGERTHCLVEELASSIGQNCKYVQKDLKKMIRKGYFKEGYLDRRETLLITDRSTYQQYLNTQEAYEHREMMKNSCSDDEVQKKSSSVPQKEEKKLSPECRELIEEGQRYIHHVKLCNDRISDIKMSEKLDRLELVITRIFCEAERNPEVIADLKKLMSYYLPTTRKLLDAYCELDGQPIRGQNVENTKKEIEAALDTINEAFENLLDDLFEEIAWDISSDISVLQTMLRQEGLTGAPDFTKTK